MSEYYERIDEEARALPLLLALITKRTSSSTYLAMVTLSRIIERRAKALQRMYVKDIEIKNLDEKAKKVVDHVLGISFEDYGELSDESNKELKEPDEVLNNFVSKCLVFLNDYDVDVLRRLFEYVKNIIEKGDSRLKVVINTVKQHVGNGDKVIIFTEYKDTARYIYDKLRENLSDYADEIALITSEEIEIPKYRGKRRLTIENIKKALRHGDVKVIVSTNIAAKGLNLQVANIVIHYEPS